MKRALFAILEKMRAFFRCPRGRLCGLAALLGLLALPAPAVGAEVFLAQPPAQWKERETLEWTVFDTNEGDAMLLRCGGESILVDGGPQPFREKLRDALEARDLRHLKCILSTHYHDDHIDGLYHLFRYGFTAEEYLHPYSDKAIAADLRGRRTVAAARENGVAVRRVTSGEALSLGKAKIQVFQCTTVNNTNARSLLLKVTYGRSALLLCADITGEAQHFFLENLPADTLKADLIKLPHHGITPVVKGFLDAVAPEAAVATNCQKRVGSRTLGQLKSRALSTLFSGEGTVCAVTDGTDWYLYQTPGAF